MEKNQNTLGVDNDLVINTKELVTFSMNKEYDLKINNNYLAVLRDRVIITFYDFKWNLIVQLIILN